jgi:hypothetical protein
MEPADFMARLFELAREGNLEALTALMRPGAIKLLRQPLTGILLDADGTREGLEAALQDLSFRFEERPDGALRLHLEGLPPGAIPDAPLFLLPDDDGGWKLGAERDLPGSAAEAERATARLQLLAVCQGTYLMDGLGFGPGYAPTARDLADGLERSGVYGGALAPELVTATDTGRPLEGYIFGRLPSQANEVFYYAIPAAPSSGNREALVIDGRGKIWAKDLEGGPLPAEWPAGDPSKEGWR